MKKIIVEIEITDSMFEDAGNCGEDADCDNCECRIGYEDCVFNHKIIDSERFSMRKKHIDFCKKYSGVKMPAKQVNIRVQGMFDECNIILCIRCIRNRRKNEQSNHQIKCNLASKYS